MAVWSVVLWSDVLYVEGMCVVDCETDGRAMVYIDSGLLRNVHFRVVDWFTITYLNLNCMTLTVEWFRHTADIILYCCTCHLEYGLMIGRNMSVVTA
jgi:hypothetical protein